MNIRTWLNFILIAVVVMIFMSNCKKSEDINDPTQSETVKDIEGNVYTTVTIGTQVWMVENLKTTKYHDGTAIPNISSNTAWANLTSPGYCWHNNDAANKNIYGALYNWYTLNLGKLCPTGWHVPSDAEWTILTNFLGGESVAGGKLKEIGIAHWLSPNTSATNESGFTALPGGSRNEDGTFSYIKNSGYWWRSIDDGTNFVWNRSMYHDNGQVYRVNGGKKYGLSVRCIKD